MFLANLNPRAYMKTTTLRLKLDWSIIQLGKFVTKIFFFFSDNAKKGSSENLWKMISAGVKANKNNKK